MKLNNKWIWVWPLSDVHCSDFIEKCEEILLIPTAFQHCTSHQTTLQLTSNSNRFKFGTTWKVPSFGEPTQTCPTQLDHRRRKGKVFPTQRSVRGGGKLFLLLSGKLKLWCVPSITEVIYSETKDSEEKLCSIALLQTRHWWESAPFFILKIKQLSVLDCPLSPLVQDWLWWGSYCLTDVIVYQ